MTKYRTAAGRIGEHIYTTETGNFVLLFAKEHHKETTSVLHPESLEEVQPWLFYAKAVGGHHHCHYEAPEGVRFEVGDLLVSDSGNIYKVLEVDTYVPGRPIKKVFEGRRLVTEPL